MSDLITLVSYNVLADSYVRRERYPDVPESDLDPSLRRRRLINELQALDADVLCLQELERRTFDSVLGVLCSNGFDGAYRGKARGQPDGCGCFYRRDRIAVREERVLVYADRDAAEADSGHIAQILRLDAEGFRFSVANTHLKWDAEDLPPAAQWGFRQAQRLVEAVEAEPDSAWIVCGDFNGEPSSPRVAAFEAAGFARANDHPTSWTRGHPRTIDFVLHRGPLRVTEASTSVAAPGALPNARHPSDHLPVRVAISPLLDPAARRPR